MKYINSQVDALVATRGAEGEHEASRRLKTELFSEMDGIASSSCQVRKIKAKVGA